VINPFSTNKTPPMCYDVIGVMRNDHTFHRGGNLNQIIDQQVRSKRYNRFVFGAFAFSAIFKLDHASQALKQDDMRCVMHELAVRPRNS